MSFDALTTSGINQLINNYKYVEQVNRLSPLEQRKAKYQSLSSIYGNVSSKLDSFKSVLEDLADTDTSSIYNTRTATSSDSKYVDLSVSSKAAASSYQIRVNQLAQSDSLVSSTLDSDTASTVAAGTQNFRFRSGDYEANVEVEFEGTETNKELMEKVRDAINNDSYAKTLSTEFDKNTAFTMDATNNTFDIDVDGTTTTVTIDSSEWASITDYDTLFDVLTTNINEQVDGVTATKVDVEGTDNVRFEIKGNSTANSFTINSTGLDGAGGKVSAGNTLMDHLGIVEYKEKGARSVVSASVFSPTSSQSKLSLVAAESGFDNRLLIDSNDALTAMGLTDTILSNRYRNTDDGTTTNDTEAGFTFGTLYQDGAMAEQGTAESETNNLLNAMFKFNGISIYRNDNVVTDLLEGVTLTLNSSMDVDDPDIDLEITDDNSSIKSSVEDFVKKFNDVYNYMKINSSSTAGGSRGVLIGDPTTSSLLNSFSSFAYKNVEGIADGNIKRLADLGITFDPFTGLSIDDATLTDKLDSAPDQVQAFFNTDNGLANLFLNQIEPVLGTDGSLANAKESFEKNITTISDRITYTNESIDKSASVLRKQYEALQQQLVSLLMSQSYLTGSQGESYF